MKYRRPLERNGADVGIIIDTSLLAEELCIFHSVCRRGHGRSRMQSNKVGDDRPETVPWRRRGDDDDDATPAT